MPAMKMGSPWTVKSDAQDRPLRTTVTMDPATASVVKRENFGQLHIIDRVVGVGIAAHEGQLFGLMNQLISLATAMGLVLLSVSAVVLWWRRRNVGVLGAPLPTQRPRWTFGLVAVILALALYLPAMAVSLAAVITLEKIVFSRIHSVSRWLGFVPA
jgi:uncharacterized iron-regulated membrane protein